jgi:hypothetical protein
MKDLLRQASIEQSREELIRLRIVALIRAGKIKEAHKLARPYLKTIETRNKMGYPTPTGWIHISKCLCTQDLESYGLSKENSSAQAPSASTWVHKAMEIVESRLQGIRRALVPASLALALVAQVIHPTRADAGGQFVRGETPDGISLTSERTNQFGRLGVKATSNLDKDDKFKNPELVWEFEDRKKISPRGIAKVVGSSKGGDALVWSMPEVKYNDDENYIEGHLTVENTSNREVDVTYFSLSDSSYTGCSLYLSNEVCKEYTDYRSPSKIPPKAKAIYYINMQENALPTLKFKTGEGEEHSLIIKIPSKKDLLSPENMEILTYKAKNTSFVDLDVIALLEGPGELLEIEIENSKGKSTLAPNKAPTIHPNNQIRYKILAPVGSSPILTVNTKSREGHRKYEVQYSEPQGVTEKFAVSLDRLSRFFGINPNAEVDWDSINTTYTKARSALVEFYGDEEMPRGLNLISSIKEDSLKETERTSTSAPTRKLNKGIDLENQLLTGM